MKNFLPDMYKKDIYSIDYEKLKEKGIKVLVYDFDNTIVEDGKICDYDKYKDFFKNLKKDFEVYILSNTIVKKKISLFSKECGIKYIMFARKPSKKGFLKVQELSGCKKNEICMIGDQLLTDIYGSNRLGYFSIFLTPIGKDGFFLTRFNRIIENKIFDYVLKKHNIERGKYYD